MKIANYLVSVIKGNWNGLIDYSSCYIVHPMYSSDNWNVLRRFIKNLL